MTNLNFDPNKISAILRASRPWTGNEPDIRPSPAAVETWTWIVEDLAKLYEDGLVETGIPKKLSNKAKVTFIEDCGYYDPFHPKDPLPHQGSLPY